MTIEDLIQKKRKHFESLLNADMEHNECSNMHKKRTLEMLKEDINDLESVRDGVNIPVYQNSDFEAWMNH